MPLGPGVRYRWKTYPSGKKVRLAFRNNKVIEVKKKGGVAKKVSDLSSSTDPLALKALKRIRR